MQQSWPYLIPPPTKLRVCVCVCVCSSILFAGVFIFRIEYVFWTVSVLLWGLLLPYTVLNVCLNYVFPQSLVWFLHNKIFVEIIILLQENPTPFSLNYSFKKFLVLGRARCLHIKSLAPRLKKGMDFLWASEDAADTT